MKWTRQSVGIKRDFNPISIAEQRRHLQIHNIIGQHFGVKDTFADTGNRCGVQDEGLGASCNRKIIFSSIPILIDYTYNHASH